jgi:uncharacterized DUF497 family protein
VIHSSYVHITLTVDDVQEAKVLIREFEWDDDNIQHIALHGVDFRDIDAILMARITVTKNKRRASGDYRFRGRGRSGQPVTVIVTGTAIAGRWRPITARYGP